MKRKRRSKYLANQAICWTCRHAVPTEQDGCSWSLDGIPVEGWTATPSKYIKGSYHILFCPQYRKDTKKKTYSDEYQPWNRLATEVVILTVKDYMEAAVALMENHDLYVEALHKMQGYEAFQAYANSLHNKYRLRQKSPLTEDWWGDIADLVSAARKRHTKKMWRQNALVNEYTQHVRTVSRCEKFMLSEDWSLYTDADGERTLKTLRMRSGYDPVVAIINIE